MITLFKRIVVLLFITTLLAIVGMGCNTAHGFGKDMQTPAKEFRTARSNNHCIPCPRKHPKLRVCFELPPRT